MTTPVSASPDPAAPRSFTSSFVVRSYELDGLGHVNHAVFLNYLEQARFDALAAGGFPLEVMEERGWAVHVVRVEIDYRRECRFRDELFVTTSVGGMRNSSMQLRQTLHRVPAGSREAPPRTPSGSLSLPPGADLAAEALITAVWIGPSGRPMRIPDDVRSALKG